MDIINTMNKINAIGRYVLLTVFALMLVSTVFASNPKATESSLKSGLKTLCQASQMFLGATAMILVVLAGTTYAIGQMLGAETRARASVWATAMLTGAVIGIVIYVVAPMIIIAMVPGASLKASDPCSF
jgi:hypothetical protein